jgi:phage shock protein E
LGAKGHPREKRVRYGLVVGLWILATLPCARAVEGTQAPNAAIDMAAYLRVAEQAAMLRETHRLSEAEFIRLSQEPGTTVLDARSRAKYDLLHVKGAINLSFADIASESLERMLPDRNARILIYCNNNFLNAPGPFPSKLPSAALNISTYIALYDYGYRNVYELGPLLDINATEIEFEAPGAP